jgi:ribonucleoside-diphosphate reductase alpha chain
VTHKVVIQTNQGIDPNEPVEVFITVGLYDDGRPGEVFIRTVNEHKGPYEQWAIALSFLLQSKTDFELVYQKFAWANYEPSGLTDNPEIRSAKSITDYVVRWIAKEFKLIEEVK